MDSVASICREIPSPFAGASGLADITIYSETLLCDVQPGDVGHTGQLPCMGCAQALRRALQGLPYKTLGPVEDQNLLGTSDVGVEQALPPVAAPSADLQPVPVQHPNADLRTSMAQTQRRLARQCPSGWSAGAFQPPSGQLYPGGSWRPSSAPAGSAPSDSRRPSCEMGSNAPMVCTQASRRAFRAVGASQPSKRPQSAPDGAKAAASSQPLRRPHSAVELQLGMRSSFGGHTSAATLWVPPAAPKRRPTSSVQLGSHKLQRQESSPAVRGPRTRSRVGQSVGGGLRKKRQSDSLFPKSCSDIHDVIAHMREVQETEAAKIAADEAALIESMQTKKMEVTKLRDLWVLKYPELDGTRLMLRRWGSGAYVHFPKQAGPPLKTGACAGPPFKSDVHVPHQMASEPQPASKKSFESCDGPPPTCIVTSLSQRESM